MKSQEHNTKIDAPTSNKMRWHFADIVRGLSLLLFQINPLTLTILEQENQNVTRFYTIVERKSMLNSDNSQRMIPCSLNNCRLIHPEEFAHADDPWIGHR